MVPNNNYYLGCRSGRTIIQKKTTFEKGQYRIFLHIRKEVQLDRVISNAAICIKSVLFHFNR